MVDLGNSQAPQSGGLLFGGDYNPEQWPEAVWEDDMRLLTEAGVNCVTLNVFSWSLLQPAEDEYSFTMLDRIVERVSEAGLRIVMGTSTGALPAWMATRHPDVCRVDELGRRHLHGVRENACLSSPTYRTYAPRLAGRIAQRYSGLENLICWHVSNEYYGQCFCQGCARGFREWLKRHHGTIEALNEAWGSNFWSHTYYSFDEINPPNQLADRADNGIIALPGLALDYNRFFSDLVHASFREEKQEIRAHDPLRPVTTNLMPIPDYDYATWAPDLDVIAWDSYPGPELPTTRIGMRHAIMRGLKNGRPFLLMEQTPSRQSLTAPSHRPGQLRQRSWQAVAQGADSVMFFQMRQSRGGCEQFHGAVIGSDGTNRTRLYRTIAELGSELEKIGPALRGSEVRAEAAVIFDWPSMWALHEIGGPGRTVDYPDEVHAYYHELVRRGIGTDVISSTTTDLSRYKLIVAPLLYVVGEAAQRNLHDYVVGGGRVILTTLAGAVDEHSSVHQGEAPVPFRDLLGVWDEELVVLPAGEQVRIEFEGRFSEPADSAGHGTRLVGLLRADPQTEVLARFRACDHCEAMPAVTRRRVGDGQAIYVGTLADPQAIARVTAAVLEDVEILEQPVPEDVETTVRVDRAGQVYRFLTNACAQPRSLPLLKPGTDLVTGRRVAGELVIPAFGVLIVAEDS